MLAPSDETVKVEPLFQNLEGNDVSVTLFSTEPLPSPIERYAVVTERELPQGREAFNLFPEGGYRRAVEAAANQMPWLAGDADVPLDQLRLPRLRFDVSVEKARLLVFGLPYGNFVFGIALSYGEFDPSLPEILPDLIQGLDDGRHQLRIGGKDLLAACRGLNDQLQTSMRSSKWGPDFHHLTALRDRSLSSGSVNLALAQRLVSRRNEMSRPDFLTVRLPREANRYRGSLAALTPGATVLIGQSAPDATAMVLSVVLNLGALSSVRQVQRSAHHVLRALRTRDVSVSVDRQDHREWLRLLSEELEQLELDLSFGVEGYLHLRILIPSLTVEQFHSELVGALSLRQSAEATSSMLERVSRVVAVEHNELASADRHRQEGRARIMASIAGVLGLVTSPLSLAFAFLGINAREI